MNLSYKELASICEQASTLSERLAGEFLSTGTDEALAARRLSQWTRMSAGSQRYQLAAMLESSGRGGVSESELLGLLGPVKLAEGAPFPGWTLTLTGLIEWVSQNFARSDSGFVKGRIPGSARRHVPFASLYWPMADFAWSKLKNTQLFGGPPITEAARHGLQEYLVRRISKIVSENLYPSFLAHLSFAASGMMRHFFGAGTSKKTDQSDTHLYASFVAEQGKDGLRSFFVRHPVAARLVAEVIQFWTQFADEFLLRLQSDHHELGSRFANGKFLGQLRSIQAGVSDPHHGGRSVLILQFRGGTRVVYKPRPMIVDRLFNDLLRELNSSSTEIDLGVLRVYERGEYGWMEFGRHSACADKQAAKRYYQRAGALVGLTHWLHGIDFHRENVVAAGEYPLLIDLECLAHPLRPEEQVTGNAELALGGSVLRSGLLPLWQPRFGKTSRYDNCGFAGPVGQRSFLPTLTWKNINTDRMRWTNQTIEHHHSSHRATMEGRLLDIGSYEAEVVSGYERTVARLHSDTNGASGALRGRLHRTIRRRLKRPTFVYGVISRQSLATGCLQHGIERSIALMQLPCLLGEEQDWIKEHESLERLDIPYFQQSEVVDEATPDCLEPGVPSFASQIKLVRFSVQKRAKLNEGQIQILPPNRRPARG